jgi:hypothetical protein
MDGIEVMELCRSHAFQARLPSRVFRQNTVLHSDARSPDSQRTHVAVQGT